MRDLETKDSINLGPLNQRLLNPRPKTRKYTKDLKTLISENIRSRKLKTPSPAAQRNHQPQI